MVLNEQPPPLPDRENPRTMRRRAQSPTVSLKITMPRATAHFLKIVCLQNDLTMSELFASVGKHMESSPSFEEAAIDFIRLMEDRDFDRF